MQLFTVLFCVSGLVIMNFQLIVFFVEQTISPTWVAAGVILFINGLMTGSTQLKGGKSG